MSEFVVRIDAAAAPYGLLPARFAAASGVRSSISASHLVQSTDHGLCISGNWRLTNREALAEALNLASDTDGAHLIAEGWARWRDGLFDRLCGSFAICIFDLKSGQAIIARDVFGLEPIFYISNPDSLIVSNLPWAARSASGGRFDQNLLAIADYIQGEMVDKAATFHSRLLRLPPASILKWAPGSPPQIKTYWSLEQCQDKIEISRPVEQFRDVLDRSVFEAVHDADHIGVTLSGGLDSSSLFASVFAIKNACVKVSSYTKTFQDADWNDGPFVNLLRQERAHSFFELEYERHHPLEHMQRLVRELDGPSHAYGLSSSFALNLLAADQQTDVLLDGHGGDEVASYGLGLLNELAQAGQWLTLWKQILPAAEFYECSRAQLFARYLAHVPSLRGIARRYLTGKLTPLWHEGAEPSPLAQDLKLLLDEKRFARKSVFHRLDHDEKMLMAEAMSLPLQPHSLETLTLSARAAGVRRAMPFYNRELVELCYALPSSEKFANGMMRAVLRRSMEGRVPEPLRLRSGKFDFFPTFQRALFSDRALVRSWADSSNRALHKLVNGAWLDTLWERIDRNDPTIDRPSIRALWRVATLAMWLDDPTGAPRDLNSLKMQGGL